MKTVSLTWPWEWKTPELIIDEVAKLGLDSVCIRAFNGGAEWGNNAYAKLRFGGKTNHDVEKAAKARGMTTPVWGPIYLRWWLQEIRTILAVIAYYNPPAVFIDFEGKYAQKNIGNLGAFLRGLGRVSKPLYLQSYRRPSLHPWVQWHKWFSYRDLTTGEYIIDGVGAQLYPIGVGGKPDPDSNPDGWRESTKRDVEDYLKMLRSVGRENIKWFPTLPTFPGAGYEGLDWTWKPQAEELQAQSELLHELLGDRIQPGVNFWDLSGLTIRKGGLGVAVQDWVSNLVWGKPEPPVEPPDPLDPPPVVKNLFMDLPEVERRALLRDELIREGALDQDGRLK